ncbi:hypothetical protein L0128_14035 [candidate division KSB1 bacterium]|nr:hypothetical protein [candidate division KSB1 bacterium]
MIEQAIILDACALLNLYASDYFSQILADVPSVFYILDLVKNESIYIRVPENPGAKRSIQPFLDQLIHRELLKVTRLESSIEQHYFIDLATELEDGEAATIAKALVNKMQIVTDDRKAIRTIRKIDPEPKWLTSLDLIKIWGEMKPIDSQKLKCIFQNIQLRANYFPHQSHPLFSWWEAIMRSL